MPTSFFLMNPSKTEHDILQEKVEGKGDSRGVKNDAYQDVKLWNTMRKAPRVLHLFKRITLLPPCTLMPHPWLPTK